MKRNKRIKEWTVDICKPAQAPQACRSSKQKPEFDREAEEDNLMFWVFFLKMPLILVQVQQLFPLKHLEQPVSSDIFNVSEDTGLYESVCSVVTATSLENKS